MPPRYNSAQFKTKRKDTTRIMGNKRKFKLITDSGCDIPEGMEKQYNIDIMPFNILIDDVEYWERTELSPQRFYELAGNSAGIPKTTQITVERFEEKMLEYYKAGCEDIIFVLINSTGSKTYENALFAKENLMKKAALGKMNVYVIDSHCYSMGYGYPVVEAAKKLNAGQSVASAVAYLEDWFNCLEIYIIGFDLRHMKKSGRISAAAAFLGELMGLKPVISLIDGVSAVVKKSRGEKTAINDAVNHISSRAVPGTAWLLLRTTCSELENSFVKYYSKKVGAAPLMESYSGAAVSANAGIKFIGVIVRGKPRR